MKRVLSYERKSFHCSPCNESSRIKSSPRTYREKRQTLSCIQKNDSLQLGEQVSNSLFKGEKTQIEWWSSMPFSRRTTQGAPKHIITRRSWDNYSNQKHKLIAIVGQQCIHNKQIRQAPPPSNQQYIHTNRLGRQKVQSFLNLYFYILVKRPKKNPKLFAKKKNPELVAIEG